MNRLNRAIAWYNAIREGSHETEVALIEKEISAIDTLLGRGVEEFTWNDDCESRLIYYIEPSPRKIIELNCLISFYIKN